MNTDSPIDSVAPAATLYLGNFNGYTGGDIMTWCRGNGVNIINYSYTTKTDGSPGVPDPTDYTSGQDAYDLQQDWVAINPPYPLFVAASGDWGDQSGKDTVVNRNHNGLVVGGTDTHGDSNPANDTIWPKASWRNYPTPHNDFELPNLVGPSKGVLSVRGIADGTSASAPMVAGVAALVAAENRSSFNAWPEQTRAVLLATAKGHADQPQFTRVGYNGDSALGAGVLSAFDATVLAFWPFEVTAPNNSPTSMG